MNNKINIPALVAHLALKSGLSKEQSERFISEFFGLIEEALKEGDTVKIKSLGTFKTMNVETRKSININTGEEILIPGHRKIVFIPSKELAEEINAPFSMFETVELNPEAESALIDESERKLQPIPESVIIKEEKEEESEEETLPVISEEETDSNISEEEVDSDISGEESLPNISEEEVDSDISGEEAVLYSESEEIVDAFIPSHKKSAKKFWWGFICGVILALIGGLCAYWFFIRAVLADKVNEDNITEQETVGVNNTVAEADSLAADTIQILQEVSDSVSISTDESYPDTKPSDMLAEDAIAVKDVIGDHYYLTTMAAKHYGNNNFWPYIYEENKSFLGHPDRIKPGTAVMVPPLSKYGVSPSNPADIRKAKQLGEEIYKKWR
ncbi:MAG: HU family DNA-binding protein [Muribaculaceae bacterium]|nr:HU family DNA-binding protein [Muribaculaceae bacterium]